MVIYVKLTSQILKYEKISIFKNDLGIAYKLNIYKYDSVNKLTSELIEIDNKKLTFSVVAFDEMGEIGRGTHMRYIINPAKFMGKIS